MADLFSKQKQHDNSYGAEDIEVLEGLEPVRRRPGMYIGGTDERALHHLVGEILDNAMDEAVAGHANRIEIHLGSNNSILIKIMGVAFPSTTILNFRRNQPSKSSSVRCIQVENSLTKTTPQLVVCMVSAFL